jgi:MFS family permease
VEGLTRRIAWTSAVIHGLVHASVLLLPTVLGDLQREFGVSLLAVVGVANVMYLVFGLAAVPAGYLADRVGSRSMLLLAAGGCTMALVTISVAPTFAWLSMGLVLLGLSAGIYHPSGLSMLSRSVASPEQGRAIGIHGVGGNFGEALAPVWAAIFATQFGWRYGFAAAAALSLVGGMLTLTLPDVERWHRHGHAHGRVRFSWRGFVSSLAHLWRSRPLRWLLLGTFAGGFVYRGVLTFLPMHLGERSGGLLSASLLTSLVLLAGMVAQRLGGQLADRLPRERLFLTEMALFAPVLVLLGLSSGVGLAALALAFGFLWYMAQPLGAAIAAAHADTRDHGLVFGVQFASTFGLGSFATTLGGLLTAEGGTQLAFMGFGAIALVQLVAAMALVASVRVPRTA